MSLWTKLRDAIVRPVLGAAINTVAPGLGQVVLPKPRVTPTPQNWEEGLVTGPTNANAVTIGRAVLPHLPGVVRGVPKMIEKITKASKSTAPATVTRAMRKRFEQRGITNPKQQQALANRYAQNKPANRLRDPMELPKKKKTGTRKPSCCKVCTPAQRANTPAKAARETNKALERERKLDEQYYGRKQTPAEKRAAKARVAARSSNKRDTRTNKTGKRKFSPAQIAAQKQFAARARAGTLRR